MSNYPLATSTWDEKELKAIKDVIDKDKFTMGQFVNTFEKNFGKFIGRKYGESKMNIIKNTSNISAHH